MRSLGVGPGWSTVSGLEKGLNDAVAYALASGAVDFKIAEAVDQVRVVVGMIRK